MDGTILCFVFQQHELNKELRKLDGVLPEEVFNCMNTIFIILVISNTHYSLTSTHSLSDGRNMFNYVDS